MTSTRATIEEASPLLSPRDIDQAIDTAPPCTNQPNSNYITNHRLPNPPPVATDKISRKSSLDLFLLTLSIAGLTTAWSVELSNGTPYLLTLGISKSLLALVWIAAPLSGLLVQPYIGLKSDNCHSRFGRRRPFMLGGAIATAASLMALAWVREGVSAVWYSIGVVDHHDEEGEEEARGVQITTIILAVALVCALDIAINVLQASSRALVVDAAPAHQQDVANAWALRMASGGNILGYLLGYLDLPARFPLLLAEQTQFQILCLLSSLFVLLTMGLTCATTCEQDTMRNSSRPRNQSESRGLRSFFTHLLHTALTLPPQIKNICLVQCFSFLGWFPVLFYSSTYIAELYVHPILETHPEMGQEKKREVWEEGVRMGTRALFWCALVTAAAGWGLPLVVGEGGGKRHTIEERACDEPDSAHAIASPRTFPTNRTSRCSLLSHLCHHIHRFQNNLTLPQTWLLSHLLFAVLMLLTFLTSATVTGASLLIALAGISWAVTNWIPFALIARAIRQQTCDNISGVRASQDEQEHEHEDDDGDERSGNVDIGAGAGVVLGIHNIAIAAPQVLATLLSAVVFAVLHKSSGGLGDGGSAGGEAYEGDGSVVWVLRLGGLAALGAAWFTRRVRE